MEKHDRWLAAMSIVIVLAYAWLTAWSLEPRWQPPSSVASGVIWLENGRTYSSAEIARRDLGLVTRVQEELQEADTALSLMGPFRVPPSVVIHLQGGFRYVVDGERIDLSDRIAAAPGQLTKALLKAWWYQRPAAAWAASSLLRFEVITDVLTAIARNEAVIGSPASGGAEPFPELGPWLDFASSYDSSRDHSWNALELRNFSGRAPRMNPLAFRPLLAAMLWSAFAKTSPLERLALARSWVRSLNENKSSFERAPALPPESLAEWRDWLRGEVQWLAGAVLPVEDGLRAADLLPKAPLAVGSAVFAPDASGEFAAREAVNDPVHDTWALKSGAGETWLLTREKSSERQAWLKISDADWRALRPASFLWAGCRAPSVGEILAASGGAEKLIFVSLCERSALSAAVRDFARGGLRELARGGPEIEFMQLRRSALELALRQGQLRAERRLSEFLRSPRQADIFGIDRAQWSSEMKAFRVIGAIEAFEWIRGKELARSRPSDPGSSSRL